MNREIKFRAWLKDYKTMITKSDFGDATMVSNGDGFGIVIDSNWLKQYSFEIMQFTGLKDKNKPINNCIYEDDILSLDGIVIGNVYENKDLLKIKTNFHVKGIGTKDWRATEQKALDVGCEYTQ